MASGGYYRRTRRHRLSKGGLSLLCIATIPSLAAAREASITLPPSTLDVALIILARETNSDIVSTDPALRSISTAAVRGEMSVRAALARLLHGTGYRAVAVVNGGYRVERIQGMVAKKSSLASPRSPRRAPADIIVTASKQRVPLLRYPGSLTVIDGTGRLLAAAHGDMSDVVRTQPILQSTQLGLGRNKVFIRGIADSSFNGSTQSTASIYLDDVQLNFTGPDPGLRLYDMQSLDIMEGPQGTLYGAGAIGGVIRLTSNPVDLFSINASIAGGVTVTDRGAPGYDLSGMVNLPIEPGAIGVRGVAYKIRDGGYIDDNGRRLADINRVDTTGGRLSVRAEPGESWRIEITGAGQHNATRDGQYAERVEGPLARRSQIAQPFESRLLLGRMTIAKDWSTGLRLVSASGIVGYDVSDVFDAGPLARSDITATPTTYHSNSKRILLSHEMRLSWSCPNCASWVAGITLISDRDILLRSISARGAETSIIGVTNVTKAASLFGEATVPLLRGFSATAGARLTAARIDGEPSSRPRSSDFVKGRSTLRVDPTLAVSWLLAPELAAFARYQTGYRTGGLAVARGVGRVADYQADHIVLGEVGLRKLRGGTTGLAVSSSLSMAHWTGIQADLLNRRGQPYTVNLGNAEIQTLEGVIDWVSVRGLGAVGSFLYTYNQVSGAIADLSRRNNRRLPETPPIAGRAELSYESRVQDDITLRVGGSASYVGRSVLGTGDLLDISQGNYVTLGMSTGAKWRKLDFSLAVENLTDRSANRFAFGNPFTLSSRSQTTPLRPLNLRFSIATAW